jgi:hypothetical protein
LLVILSPRSCNGKAEYVADCGPELTGAFVNAASFNGFEHGQNVSRRDCADRPAAEGQPGKAQQPFELFQLQPRFSLTPFLFRQFHRNSVEGC